MTKKDNFILLFLIYALAACFLFAVLRYLVFFEWNMYPEAEDQFVEVRVFYSAPALAVLGTLLILIYKKNVVHRILGVMFLLASIAWAFAIVKAVMEEA